MNNLHPHWHSTDDDEAEAETQSIPVRITHASKDPEELMTVSRKPAAFFGMLIVAALGVTFFHESQNIVGQLPSQPPIIHITDDGLQPEEITVEQGVLLEWINEQEAPQILESDTLCNAIDECLYTDIAFPGDHVVFAIPADVPTGTYQYASITDPTLRGQITIIGQTLPLAPADTEEIETDTIVEENFMPEEVVPIPEVKQEPTYELPEEVLPVIEEEPEVTAITELETINTAPPLFAPLVPEIEDVELTPASVVSPSAQALPMNPNTVGIQQIRGPVTTASVGETQHSGAPPITGYKPFKQPDTGIGTWTLLMFSAIGVALVARRAKQHSL